MPRCSSKPPGHPAGAYSCLMLLCLLPAQILIWVATQYDHSIVGSGMITLPLAHGADLSFLVSNDQKHHISCPRAIPHTQDILWVFILPDIALSATCPNPSFQGSQIWYCCSLGLAGQNLKTLIVDFSTLRRARKFSGPAFESGEFTLSSGVLFSLTLLQPPDPCQYLY